MPLRTLLIFTLALALGVASRSHEAHAAGPELVFPRGDAALTPAASAQLHFLHELGCRALALTPAERAAVTAAAERVANAVADPGLAALLDAKTDWRVAGDGRWQRDAGAGANLLAAWSEASRLGPVSVIAYAPGEDGACAGELGDGAIHALTPIGVPVILFNARYLERQTHAPDGGRDLTRTLAHELTHVLGFSHQDAPGAVGLATYNNTVPAFFGCAAMGWPDRAFVAEQCGLADYARAPTPSSSGCDAARRLADLLPGAAVSVRFRAQWLDARVRRVDVAGERVEIDYGLAEVGAAWVDGCRVRHHDDAERAPGGG